MLTNEQVIEIKRKLLSQLENFPEDKREAIKNKILSMTNEEIENFLKENQLLSSQQKKLSENNIEKCIFCAISSKKIPSFIIDENENFLAVLEINPISKGNCLIIPKKHLKTQQITSEALNLAKKISIRIKKKLKPKEIKIQTKEINEHSAIEIIPIYGDEKERKRANEEELKEIQEKLKKIKKDKKPKENKSEIKKEEISLPRLKPRIP